MAHHFTWPHGAGFIGADVEYILRQYGIKCHSREMNNQLGLSVSDAQANWAETILCDAGVPLTSPLLDPQNAVRAARRGYTMPVPWGVTVGAGDAVGRLVDWIDRLMGGMASRRASAFVRSRAASTKRHKSGIMNTLKGLW